MANRRESLPRLNIQHQQVPMYPLQQSFYPMPSALHTPMQPLFNSQTPPAPGRPTTHAHQASVQLTAAGIHPPNLATPISSHFPRPSMILGSAGQPPSHPFPNRNRRQLSIGGPPKAVLGGPARKLSPLPSTSAQTAPVPASTTPQKPKKVIVNLPKETVPGKDGELAMRSSWARSPLDNPFQYQDCLVTPAELTTAELFPPDNYRLHLPDSIDVYLPGRVTWDNLKKKVIEAKLEKLGVERGSGSNVPHIYAPHARAASVSSPADPALLLFKLNRLQQTQETKSPAPNMSSSLSPNPLFAPFGLSPSPHRGSRFMTNRHGHTMSLAQPPSYQSSLFSPSPSPYNPFGGTVPVSDSGVDNDPSPPDAIHAPQGRVPMTAPTFVAPPLSAVGGSKTHIDFIRGFGLETPMESEEEMEPGKDEPEKADDRNDNTQERDLEESYVDEVVEIEDDSTTAPHSRLHSRHISRLSAALSLRSVGGNLTTEFRDAPEETEEGDTFQEHGEVSQHTRQQTVLDDEVEEWTGSEDIYLGIDTSDDESIGEWSNPSDEERARQQRVERRMRRQRHQLDQPRRLPNFPLPPDNTLAFYPRAGTDDDLISNPSEENMVLARRAEFLGVSTEQYYESSNSNVDAESPRLTSLPPLPHSRAASGQYSIHDPYVAHSRAASENFVYPSPAYHRSQPPNGRRESLNPLAKPFVFGAARTSGSFQPFCTQSSTPPLSSGLSVSHSRISSIGKPLNVAAPEFKPGEFNFRLPSGAPQMPAPVPELPRPQLVEVSDSAQSSPFRVQGREKRQRRGSSASMEEGDGMSSFRFPMKPESPHGIRRAGSFSGIPRSQQDDSAPPFTFAGFSAVASNMPLVPHETGNISMSEPELTKLEDLLNDSSTAKADNSGVTITETIIIPQATKTKRAPIPLDFKQPGSGNTVPAGLFKALVSGDDRTRRTVRSRLNSHETLEHFHRPSMDDNNVALIAKNPVGRLVTDPGAWKSLKNDDDVFGGSVQHAHRRSSLPDALHDSLDDASIEPQDLTTRMELHRVETVIAELLDEKLAPIRQVLAKREQNEEKGLSASTEAMMADVISLFRTQLHESAMRSLDDSQVDARGDLDFQMIKDVVEEGHKGLLLAMQREFHHIVEQLPIDNYNPQEILSSVDQIGSRTVNAVVESISELAVRQEAMRLNAPARERDIIVDKLVTALSPMMHSLRNEPIDYEHLTRELTQAVKPHISQLIDLASDKRETASLIVDRILPLLPSMGSPPIDTDALTLKLITEVRRVIAPIDAFEIKEHVADLVVERLDSRLAVRDKAFNVDIVTARVTESVSHLLGALNTVPSTLNEVMSLQKAINNQQNGFVISQNELVASISDIPGQVGSQLETLKNAQDNILRKLDQPVSVVEPDVNITVIKDLMETMAAYQKNLVGQNEDITLQTKYFSEKLDALPGTLTVVADNIHNAFTELIISRDNSKREFEELRKLNTDYQIQLTKARGSHGQVRVEKDVLSEKLTIVEEDRERLRSQVKELQAGVSSKTAEMNVLESKNMDLEEALTKALARLQSSDVATQVHQESISELEKTNVELVAEKQDLKSKINSLELEVTFATREKETTLKALESLQKQHDGLALQQSKWDAIMAATEKINMVYNLLENADDEEQKELRHHRDRSKALESENTTLEKRVKELEAKAANSDRAATTMRQSLTQAQQRSTEWERRAKDYEGKLEMVQTKLDQAEETHSQLEADLSILKVQAEEQEADSRLSQDRENQLGNQITALEFKCTLLQSELEKAKSTKVVGATATPYRQQTNGSGSHPRPDSRANTVYEGRGDSRGVSSNSNTGRSPQPSVWDSMHAPTTTNGQGKWPPTTFMHTPSRFVNTPKPHQKPYPQYPRGPSPTPSTVSAVPTQGDDGWWQ